MSLFKKILPRVFLILILSSCASVKTPTEFNENSATDLPKNTPTIAPSIITPANPTSTITVTPTFVVNGTSLSWNEVLFYDSIPANSDAKEGEDVTRISILRNQQDVNQEKKWIQPQNIQQVIDIDFSTNIAVVVYAGRKGENMYKIKINEIIKKDETIFISTTIAGAPNGEIRNPVETSPYLVLTLKVTEIPARATFILISNGKEVDHKTTMTNN